MSVPLSKLVGRLRVILDDIADAPSTDSLLSEDSEAKLYLAEAQDVFCEKTGFIRDASSAEAATITTVAGQSDYALHDSIIEVMDVSYDGVPLSPVTSVGTVLSQGTSYWGYATDRDFQTLRLFGTPANTGDTINLVVWRRALSPLNISGVTEIPDRFAYYLPHYAAYKILSNQDEELIDDEATTKQLALFGNGVTEAKRNMHKMMTSQTNPMSGVGQFGWSW